MVPIPLGPTRPATGHEVSTDIHGMYCRHGPIDVAPYTSLHYEPQRFPLATPVRQLEHYDSFFKSANPSAVISMAWWWHACGYTHFHTHDIFREYMTLSV